MFTLGLCVVSQELGTLKKLCTNLVKNCTTEKSVFFTWCVHKNADISFHSSFIFSHGKMNISLLFTFFSDKQTKIVHAHLLYKRDTAKLISYVKIGSLLLLT